MPGGDHGFLGRAYRGLLEDKTSAPLPGCRPLSLHRSPLPAWPQSPTCGTDLLALTQARVLRRGREVAVDKMLRTSRKGLLLGKRAAWGRGQATSRTELGSLTSPEHAASGSWASVKAGTDGVCWGVRAGPLAGVHWGGWWKELQRDGGKGSGRG